MKLEFFSCSKKDFEEFLCEIGDNWRKSALCSTSRSKSEFGGKHPFFHYANLFDRQIEGLAERVKLNARKTLGFFYLLSSTLPQFVSVPMMSTRESAKRRTVTRARIRVLTFIKIPPFILFALGVII